jgi:site-specific DNA recombinase
MVWNRRSGAKLNRIAGGRATPCEMVGKKAPRRNAEADFEIVPGNHPAIVTRERWEAAQQLRAVREKSRKGDGYRGGRAKQSAHLLSGLIRCPRCGHNFGGATVSKGKRRLDGTRVLTRYYECSAYRNKGTSVCQKALVPAVPLEADVLSEIERRVVAFLQDGGAEFLRSGLKSAAKLWLEQNAPDRKAIEERLRETGANIKRLLASITPANARYVDEEIVVLGRERDALDAQLDQIRIRGSMAPDVEAIVDQIVTCLQDFQAVFKEGTPEEKKEFIRLFVERIELDAEKRVAVCRIKKFPAPSGLDAGKLSFKMVAGVRDEQQKIVFPPVDIVEIPLVARGTVLVPLAA